MKTVFSIILNMSITASYVALIIIVIRALLKFIGIPKIFSYALWVVVLVRLVNPILFESEVSLLPQNTNEVYRIVNSQPITLNYDLDEIESASTVNETQLSNVSPDINSNAIFLITFLNFIPLLWVAGILIFLCYTVYSYIQLKNYISTATLVRDNIFESDQIKMPFILGILKPKIYLPIDISEFGINYIIMHEQVHIKRKDHLIRLFSTLVLAIHWFNPIIWISYFMMIKDMEMSCDESVIKQHGKDIRVNYSNTLLYFAMKQNDYFTPLSFGESNVKSRIKNILKYKKPTFWIIIIICILLIGLAIGLSVNPPNQIKPNNVSSTTVNDSEREQIDPILEEIKTILTYKEDGVPPNPEGTQVLTLFKTLVFNELTEHVRITGGTYPITEFPQITKEDRETMAYYIEYYKSNGSQDDNIFGPWYSMIGDTNENIEYIERVEDGLKEYPILYNWVREAKSHYIKVKEFDIEYWEEAYNEYVAGGEMFNELEKVLNE